MDDRLHAWLEGEIRDEDLEPGQREEAARLRRAVGLAAASAQVDSPGMADAVMARLAHARAPRRRFVDRIRAVLVPGPLSLRPAAALAAACLAVGFGFGVWARPDSTPEPVETAAADASPTVFVRFDLRVEGATNVQLAGSFSEWQPAYDLSPSGDDHWTVTVPLTPGVHDYVFVVDGERNVLDPGAPRIADGFGSYSNRIALLASAT